MLKVSSLNNQKALNFESPNVRARWDDLKSVLYKGTGCTAFATVDGQIISSTRILGERITYSLRD